VIEVADRDGVAVLQMADGKANTMSIDSCQELTERFEEIRLSSARAVVITGAGAIFSAGVDLVRLLEGGRPYIRKFSPPCSRIRNRWWRPSMGMPSPAAVCWPAPPTGG
jgi:enoyl-CoA hydratase/carnithine racemase